MHFTNAKDGGYVGLEILCFFFVVVLFCFHRFGSKTICLFSSKF